MRSSTAVSLWALSTLLLVTGCDDTRGPTGVDPGVSGTETHVRAAAHTAGEVIELGDFALYLPGSGAPRAVLVALGGPNTRGFVTGEAFGAPFPETEAALQAMGAELRALAAERRVAILGTFTFVLDEGAAADQVILDAISHGAEASGRAELTALPILMYGLSGGAPEAAGFAARHPDRTVGTFLKVPAGVTALTTAAQRQVPTFMVLAGLDAFIDNPAMTAAYASNRSGGALWGMGLEPDVPHHSLSPAQRQLTIDWMGSVLTSRLAGASGHLKSVAEQSGWLGDPSTGAVSSWGAYKGDRSAASWFPTRGVGERWRSLIGVAP